MSNTLHVLSIGSREESEALRDALLQWRPNRLVVAKNLWELCMMPQQESFEIAILHHSLSLSVASEAAQYVRRRWPRAKIVLICAGTNILDDPLYDERRLPGLSERLLLKLLDQLAGTDRSDQRQQPRQIEDVSMIASFSAKPGKALSARKDKHGDRDDHQNINRAAP